MIFDLLPVSDRPVVEQITVSAGGLGFDSRAGQFGHSVANGLLPLRRFFETVLPRRSAAEMHPASRNTPRCTGTTTSIMKI